MKKKTKMQKDHKKITLFKNYLKEKGNLYVQSAVLKHIFNYYEYLRT